MYIFKNNIPHVFFVLILFFFSSFLCARPSTLPGMYVGLPLGKPFPSGMYYIHLPAYISVPTSGNDSSTNVAANTNTLAYVHDKKFLNATPYLIGTVSEAFFREGGGHAWIGNLYNPDLMVGLTWQLTPNFGISNITGVLFPMNTQGLSVDAFIFNERVALSYFDDNSEATVHFLYGLPQASMTPFKPSLPNYINIDLTYVVLFKKLSLGPIAFGSWDITKKEPWSQFAVGGIVGYDFGPCSLQFWLGKDTNSNHWGGDALTGFLRLLVPFENKQKVNIKKSFEI